MSRKSVKSFNRAGDTAALMLGIGLGFTLALEVISLTSEDLHKTSGLITIAARFAALIGTYLVLVGLLLVARIPWVERSVGHDR
ncbi:MAG: hypothetical protein NT174_02870, partial [Actinobacteria bacterium]|nr:hypothetical protein [Actinomycetota bacterium]